MIKITLICVGKLKEKFFLDAFNEYSKRLSGYCSFNCTELAENRLPENPNETQIAAALEKEGAAILKSIPSGSYVVSMCVEGKKLPSEGIARIIREREDSGKPKLCVIIGGSYGLSDSVKKASNLRLSVSDMTFPHHLVRVMVAEQLYRGFKINEGSAYHK